MWSFGTTMTIANDDQERQRPTISATPPAAAAQQVVAPADLTPPASTRPDTRSPILSQRSLSQLGIFFAGAGFLALSTAITRRAIARKHISGIPLFYEQSNNPVSKITGDGGFVAVEALGLATLNTMSFGIMATGGVSWAFDISSVGELRAAAQKHTRANLGEADEAAEQEIAKYFSDLLEGKDQKEGKPSLTEAFSKLLKQPETKVDQQPEPGSDASKDN
ncbi:hypothetical protein TruAng_006097 [Truncatella angustata]|nr:hypothetical protein TruAng_006097 [Truncatella angustata]